MAQAQSGTTNVLVVDDEKAICTILGQYLQKKGYTVFLTNSGEEAVEVVKANKIDLILTDIKMPGMSGVELLKWVQENYNSIPVIITTGFPTLDTAISALKLGAYDYLTKPFHLEEIGEKIVRALENRRLQEENFLFLKLVSLHEVTKVLSTLHDMKELNRSILEFSAKMVHADGGAILFLNERNNLDIVEVSGEMISRQFWGDAAVFTTVSQEVVQSDKPLIIVKDSSQNPAEIPSLPDPVQAYVAFPLRSATRVIGVLNLVRVHSGQSFSKVDLEIINVLSAQAGIAIDNVTLYQNIRNNYLQTIRAFAHAVEVKDQYTHGHSENVMQYTMLLAKHLNLPDDELENIKYAGLLHDIGKIGISEQILNKPGKLTLDEYEEIKKHPVLGARIIDDVPSLKRLVPMVLHHHEYYNGHGYPHGIVGDNIPFGARILSVADTFEAMTSDRPYRKALSFDIACDILRQERGKQFDGHIVDAFLEVISTQKIA